MTCKIFSNNGNYGGVGEEKLNIYRTEALVDLRWKDLTQHKK